MRKLRCSIHQDRKCPKPSLYIPNYFGTLFFVGNDTVDCISSRARKPTISLNEVRYLASGSSFDSIQILVCHELLIGRNDSFFADCRHHVALPILSYLHSNGSCTCCIVQLFYYAHRCFPAVAATLRCRGLHEGKLSPHRKSRVPVRHAARCRIPGRHGRAPSSPSAEIEPSSLQSIRR